MELPNIQQQDNQQEEHKVVDVNNISFISNYEDETFESQDQKECNEREAPIPEVSQTNAKSNVTQVKEAVTQQSKQNLQLIQFFSEDSSLTQNQMRSPICEFQEKQFKFMQQDIKLPSFEGWAQKRTTGVLTKRWV